MSVKSGLNIRLGKYHITSDSMQYILNEVCQRGEKASEPGSEYLSPIGYYTDLQHLITKIFNSEVGTTYAGSLRELTRSIQKANQYISRCADTIRATVNEN